MYLLYVGKSTLAYGRYSSTFYSHSFNYKSSCDRNVNTEHFGFGFLKMVLFFVGFYSDYVIKSGTSIL